MRNPLTPKHPSKSPWLLLALPALALLLLAAAPANAQSPLSATPPMGWNDWAHYMCGFTAQTILDNAHALVKSGLAAKGYNTVTIDDCWMQKTRDANGNLQADPHRFPHGMKPIADEVHALGLKFGIYEDSGSETCGKFAGSGEPQGGGPDHFLQDTRLFASWGVDYLKLDGCNVYVPKSSNQNEAYRKAYAAQAAAIKTVGRPIIFSQSAPAYFQGTPDWYSVLDWVRDYGQLWREGTDVEVFRAKNPDRSRFRSVIWNYSYNLPLGRFQKPGNWNDSDFIIGGDHGMTLPETRSQVALWSMMSAPLILSSNVASLSPKSIAVLGNQAVIAVDQDPLGKMATLVRRTANMDLLFKPLSDGSYAVAAFNRGAAPLHVSLHPADLGFGSDCRLSSTNLWNGKEASALRATVASHDTAIWKIQSAASCGSPSRTGVVTMITTGKDNRAIPQYTLCLAASGRTESCTGNAHESWTVNANGTLQSAGKCLALANGKPAMQACNADPAQQWNYNLSGNLINAASHQCLTSSPATGPQALSVAACGYNLPSQIWSLPN